MEQYTHGRLRKYVRKKKVTTNLRIGWMSTFLQRRVGHPSKNTVQIQDSQWRCICRYEEERQPATEGISRRVEKDRRAHTFGDKTSCQVSSLFQGKWICPEVLSARDSP